MALLRWMGVGPFNQQQQLLEQPKEDQSSIKPISHPDAKRYGFENVRNAIQLPVVLTGWLADVLHALPLPTRFRLPVWQYLVSITPLDLLHLLVLISCSFLVRFSLSYANSVLQALYFCPPFRELVCNTPDRSYLYPPPPVQYHPASQTTAPKSANHSKSATALYKRGPGTAHAASDPKADPSNAADVDGKDANTSPPIPSYSPTLFAALRSLFLHISHHSVDNGTIAPTAFIAKLRRENELFRNTQHQDAHEFLNYLLNKIVEELEQEDREDAIRSSPAPSQNPQDDCEFCQVNAPAIESVTGECPSTVITLTCSVPPIHSIQERWFSCILCNTSHCSKHHNEQRQR